MKRRHESRGGRDWMVTLTGAAVVMLLSGCYKATFFGSSTVVAGGDQHEEWTDFFIFGLVGEQNFDVRQFCGNTAPAMVRTGGNAGTTIISALTLGIYTPRKVYIVCSDTAAAQAVSYEMDADGRGRPQRLVRHAGPRTQEARLSAVSPDQWSARFAMGEGR